MMKMAMAMAKAMIGWLYDVDVRHVKGRLAALKCRKLVFQLLDGRAANPGINKACIFLDSMG